jgi:ABC-2 type transport system permease protein
MKELSPGGEIQMEFLYGKSDDSLFNSMGYIMLGIISFFIVFIIAGISFVRERTNQTMERLMITPVKRWQVIFGYTMGFGLFAMLQGILLLCYVTGVLHMVITGSLIAAGMIMILLSMSAICIGAFFSIFSNNEFQVMQFIPVVVIPQIFFSGLISLDTLPYHLGVLSRIFPVYYACNALKSITLKTAGLTDILPDILALFIFIILFFILNIFALKKYRRI